MILLPLLHIIRKKKVISTLTQFYETLFCLPIYLAKEQAQPYILGYPPKF